MTAVQPGSTAVQLSPDPRGVQTDAGKERKELCPDPPSMTEILSTGSLPSLPSGRPAGQLVPEGLELLPPFLSPEELSTEKKEEVVEEHLSTMAASTA